MTGTGGDESESKHTARRAYYPGVADQTLADRVALVTGASRGGGKGIALVLGEAGATVYVTGRTTRAKPRSDRPGTIDDTADELTARGGRGIAVRCDHRNEEEIEALLAQIERDHGRIDVLVNNAWGGYEMMVYYEPFWDLPLEHWELMFDGGLKTQFLTTRLALPLLHESDRALVVNTTWDVGDRYHGHLLYDTVKNAVARMSYGMSEDLKETAITVVALSPGWMYAERMKLTEKQAAKTESTEYVGRAVRALAADPDVHRWSGRVLRVIDVAREYGFTDVNGKLLSPFWEEHLQKLAE
jgi:NAD(P)-dependent dehydrogenase (short-subunit alcohol dehydrogenase family)